MNGNLFIDDYENNLGLSPELKGQFVYQKYKKKKQNIIFVTSSLYEANKYYQIIANYTSKVSLFPMDDFLTSEALAISPELMVNRLETLSILKNGPQIIITNLMGYLRFLPQPKDYYDSFIEIKKGKEYSIEKLVEHFINIGYERDTIVSRTGQIAVRGFVLDIFPINYDEPIRIEFWGDEVDKISKFN